jgi:thioredoxin-related protein
MMRRWICLSVLVPSLTLVLLGASTALGEAKGGAWSDDVDASMKKAAAQNKDVLMDFTGSDWCGWCIRLKEEVFDQRGFYEAVTKQFVLVELDFPKEKKLAAETVNQNRLWQEKLGVSGYPTIMLVDAKGKPYAKTGYREGGKDAYLKHLEELRAIRTQRDEALAKAATATGIDKAKQLDAALTRIDPELVGVAYEDLVAQIVKLDAGNQAGLKSKYRGLLGIAEMRTLMKARKMAEAVSKADEVLKELGSTGQTAQDIYLARSEACFNKGDKKAAREDLDKALKAAPEGAKVAQIKGIIARFFGGK